VELYDPESHEISEPIKIRIPGGNLKVGTSKDRFTVRIDAYWETFGESPLGVPIQVATLLDTIGVEPYLRKFKATEQPKELSLGDIDREDVGYILIVNTEGTKYMHNPSEEERADVLLRVAVFNGFEIPPHGMPFFGKPTEGPLMIHCKHGQAILQVCIFPR